MRIGVVTFPGSLDDRDALRAIRISGQAKTAALAVNQLRDQTADLNGVARINDSGVRILHAARALRKVAVGK